MNLFVTIIPLAHAIRSPKKRITSLGMNTCLDEFGENRLVQMPSSIAPALKHVSITNQQQKDHWIILWSTMKTLQFGTIYGMFTHNFVDWKLVRTISPSNCGCEGPFKGFIKAFPSSQGLLLPLHNSWIINVWIFWVHKWGPFEYHRFKTHYYSSQGKCSILLSEVHLPFNLGFLQRLKHPGGFS